MNLPFIQTPTESALTKYKQPIEFANKQLEIFWLPDEINVEKDIQSVLVDMTEAERHGVLTVLRLFTLYELKAGAEYWGSRFVEIFPRPEFRRMASVFSMFELAVHSPFYNKLNEALNVSTDEFYLSYVNNPILKARMEFINTALNDPDPLYSVGVFSMVEGAVLYSAFAFLKHFQANGKNKLNNVCRGISFSLRDEAIHAQAGAWSFKELLKEKNSSLSSLNERLFLAVEELLAHECAIIDMIFEKGDISGICAKDLQTFVGHCLDVCLFNLGVFSEAGINSPGPIGKWFYTGANNFKSNDFFVGQGSEYKRNFNQERFVW